MAIDAAGNIVVSASRWTRDLDEVPDDAGARKPTRNSASDAFVDEVHHRRQPSSSRRCSAATATSFSPYAYDGGLALDAGDNIYVTGTTRSTDSAAGRTPVDSDYNDDDPGATGTLDGVLHQADVDGRSRLRHLPRRAPHRRAARHRRRCGGQRLHRRHDGFRPVATARDGRLPVTGTSYDETYNGSGGHRSCCGSMPPAALTYGTYIGGSGERRHDGERRARLAHHGQRRLRRGRHRQRVVSAAGNAPSRPTQGGGPDGVAGADEPGAGGTNQLTYGTFLGGTATTYCRRLALDATDTRLRGRRDQLVGVDVPGRGRRGRVNRAARHGRVRDAKFDTAQTGAASLVFATRVNGFYTDVATDIALDSLSQPWVGVDSGSLPRHRHPRRTSRWSTPCRRTRSGQRRAPGGRAAQCGRQHAAALVARRSRKLGPVAVAHQRGTASREVFGGARAAAAHRTRAGQPAPVHLRRRRCRRHAAAPRPARRPDDHQGHRQALSAVHGARRGVGHLHHHAQQPHGRHGAQHHRHRQPAERGRVRLVRDQHRDVRRQRQRAHRVHPGAARRARQRPSRWRPWLRRTSRRA